MKERDYGKVKTLILVEQKWKHSQWLDRDNGFFLVGSESSRREPLWSGRDLRAHRPSLDFVVPRKGRVYNTGLPVMARIPNGQQSNEAFHHLEHMNLYNN